MRLRKVAANRFMSEMAKHFFEGNVDKAQEMANTFRKGVSEGKAGMTTGHEIKLRGKDARHFANVNNRGIKQAAKTRLARIKREYSRLGEGGVGFFDRKKILAPRTIDELAHTGGLRYKPYERPIDANGSFSSAKLHFGPVEDDIRENPSLEKLKNTILVRKVPYARDNPKHRKADPLEKALGLKFIHIEKNLDDGLKVQSTGLGKSLVPVRGVVDSEDPNIKRVIYQDPGKVHNPSKEYRKLVNLGGNNPSSIDDTFKDKYMFDSKKEGKLKASVRTRYKINKAEKKLDEMGKEMLDVKKNSRNRTPSGDIFDPIIIPKSTPEGATLINKDVYAPDWMLTRGEIPESMKQKSIRIRQQQKEQSKKMRLARERRKQ